MTSAPRMQRTRAASLQPRISKPKSTLRPGLSPLTDGTPSSAPGRHLLEFQRGASTGRIRPSLLRDALQRTAGCRQARIRVGRRFRYAYAQGIKFEKARPRLWLHHVHLSVGPMENPKKSASHKSLQTSALTVQAAQPACAQKARRMAFAGEQPWGFNSESGSRGQQHAAQLTSAEKPTATTQPSAQSAKQAKRVGYSEPAVTILLGIIHQPSPSRYRKWLLDPVGISYSPSAASA